MHLDFLIGMTAGVVNVDRLQMDADGDSPKKEDDT